MKKVSLFFAVMLAVMLAAGAMGCGGSQKGDPEQVVEDYWSAVQKGDLETAESYQSQSLGTTAIDEVNGTGGAQLELFSEVMKTVTMEIVGSEQKGDSATVSLVLTLPDMEVVGNEIMEIVNEQNGGLTNMSQADIEAITETLLAAMPDLLASAPKVERPQTVNLVWEDGDWKISSDLFGEIQTPM
jgi:hypothetical protein